MKLYRVETQAGVGPYRNWKAYTYRTPGREDGRPTPLQEFELGWLPAYRELMRRWGDVQYAYAFNDQLNRWWEGYWQYLPAEYGVSEYSINVRSVVVTPNQALYNPNARSLKRISWTPVRLLREKGSQTIEPKITNRATFQTLPKSLSSMCARQ